MTIYKALYHGKGHHKVLFRVNTVYKYEYKYWKCVFEYNSSTSTSIEYYISGTWTQTGAGVHISQDLDLTTLVGLGYSDG